VGNSHAILHHERGESRTINQNNLLDQISSMAALTGTLKQTSNTPGIGKPCAIRW
jgi:hypothetical protein